MNEILINKLSDQVKNFNLTNHQFIQDPNFSNDGGISSMLSSSPKQAENNKHKINDKFEFNEESLINAVSKSKMEVKDERFKEKMLKDAFKYMYLSKKLKFVPEYKELRIKFDEVDGNIHLILYGSFLYLLYIIFQTLDNRITYYDNIDDIIRDKPKRLYVKNKPFHFGIVSGIFSLLMWNVKASKKIENDYQVMIKDKYLKNLHFTEKHTTRLTKL